MNYKYDIKGTETEKNLQTALEGEAQATLKYRWYASLAEKAGYHGRIQLLQTKPPHRRFCHGRKNHHSNPGYRRGPRFRRFSALDSGQLLAAGDLAHDGRRRRFCCPSVPAAPGKYITE